MDVRAGYKRTEAGVIPDDWDITTLQSIVENDGLVRGPFGGALTKDIFVDRGYKVYEQQNAIYETFELGYYHIDSAKFRELERFRIKPGDFIVSCAGTIGKIYRIPTSAPEGVINQALLKITLDQSKVDARYFLAIFQSPSFQNRIKDNSHGGAMQNLVGMDTFRKTFLQVPPTLAEQRAIAAALSDADALIEALEQLLAKKRQLKQGAMQALLTGRQRLPGFEGEWCTIHLSDLGQFSKGQGIRKADVLPDGIPCIRYGEIYTHYNEYVRKYNSFISPEVASRSQRLRKGDLLFAGSGETAEGIGKCVAFLGDDEAYAGGDIIILTPIGHDSKFLGYLMNTAPVTRQFARMGQGDAVVHIRAKHVGEVEIRLPQNSEQKAISAFLSDLDVEIGALEAKLDKTRNVKQGMMQELLTGRIRLI